MQIKLLGTLDYDKIKEKLENKIQESDEIIDMLKQMEIESKIQTVSTAGRLSRFKGDVLEILDISQDKTFESNINYIKRVTKMGHDSITDHDYLVFAIKDVSPIVEQTIIAERFSSFTIKSRREVDFSNAGFYTPNFRDENGIILNENDKIKEEYNTHIKNLFDKYLTYIQSGISLEDARFILPYCYHSNIIMGVDAHTLKDMIIKFTKTKYSNIQELKEFGEKLLTIAKERAPYLVDEINEYPLKTQDAVEQFLKCKTNKEDREYQCLDHVQLLHHTQNIDDTILISAIMRRFQLDFHNANKLYQKLCTEDPLFKQNLMNLIAFESDELELTQVNFQFQIPLSFAVLTHLTRHRTHDILIPDFVPNVDLSQYKIPPKIAKNHLEDYEEIFKNNMEKYYYFKEKYGICDEDLVYFTLSGNMTNSVTNMDGKTLKHIVGLRSCNKTQWETREMSNAIRSEVKNIQGAENFSAILGPTCETQNFCKEGKECCGKIYQLKK